MATFIKKGKAFHLGPNFPTYFCYNSTSSPDIAIANNKTIHNITINPGPLTTSDHIPMIITLTTETVTIPMLSTYNMWKANWSTIKEEVHHKMNDIQLEQNMNKNQIEQKINQWYNIMEESMNKNIPLKTKHLIQKPITSPQLRF